MAQRAVAAVFAVHPLRAESVAWVTERKDVLSGFFFMLTLAAYVAYVRGGKREQAPFAGTALRVLCTKGAGSLFRCLSGRAGLLRRGAGGQAHGGHPAVAAVAVRLLAAATPACAALIWEKIPLLAIACCFCLVAVHGQRGISAVNQQHSLVWRTGNALISYGAYLGQFFCPRGLVPYYPRRAELPLWQLAAALLTLVSVTVAAIGRRGQRPTCWLVGCGTSACSCPSLGWCSLAFSPRPIGFPTCRKSGSSSHLSGPWRT